METRRLGVRSKQRAIGISDQRAQSTHLALRAALLVIDHTNKFGCFNHKVHHGGTPLGTVDCEGSSLAPSIVMFASGGAPPWAPWGCPGSSCSIRWAPWGTPASHAPLHSFECSCRPAPLPPGSAPAPLLSLSADTRGRTCSPRGRRRHHPGVRPAKGQCRSRSVLTPLALDALGPFSPHPTAQVLRLA